MGIEEYFANYAASSVVILLSHDDLVSIAKEYGMKKIPYVNMKILSYIQDKADILLGTLFEFTGDVFSLDSQGRGYYKERIEGENLYFIRIKQPLLFDQAYKDFDDLEKDVKSKIKLPEGFDIKSRTVKLLGHVGY